jgi:hypothetical protein
VSCFLLTKKSIFHSTLIVIYQLIFFFDSLFFSLWLSGRHPICKSNATKQNKKKYFMHEFVTMKQLGEESHRYLQSLSQLMSRTLFWGQMHFYEFRQFECCILVRLIFLPLLTASKVYFCWIFERKCLAANNNGFKMLVQKVYWIKGGENLCWVGFHFRAQCDIRLSIVMLFQCSARYHDILRLGPILKDSLFCIEFKKKLIDARQETRLLAVKSKNIAFNQKAIFTNIFFS